MQLDKDVERRHVGCHPRRKHFVERVVGFRHAACFRKGVDERIVAEHVGRRSTALSLPRGPDLGEEGEHLVDVARTRQSFHGHVAFALQLPPPLQLMLGSRGGCLRCVWRREGLGIVRVVGRAAGGEGEDEEGRGGDGRGHAPAQEEPSGGKGGGARDGRQRRGSPAGAVAVEVAAQARQLI